MAKVIIHDKEQLSDALQRFKRMMNKDGIMEDCQRQTYFQSNAEKRNRKRNRTKHRKK